ncbi:MAG: hypothetical protein R3A46_15125 [Thermomicrobiales bacterium]
MFLNDELRGAAIDAAALANAIGNAIFGGTDWVTDFEGRFGIVSDDVF